MKTPCALSFIVFPVALLLAGPLLTKANAQFAAFRTNAVPTQIYTISTNGDASRLGFDVWIASNGYIAGSGVRYDLAAASFNTSPTNGSSVSIVSANSRLGLPVTSRTNREVFQQQVWDDSGTPSTVSLTNTRINTTAAISILLNDGTRFKGSITKYENFYQFWDRTAVVTETNTDVNIDGVATRAGGQVGWGSGWAP